MAGSYGGVVAWSGFGTGTACPGPELVEDQDQDVA